MLLPSLQDFGYDHLCWCHNSPNITFTLILTEIQLSPEKFFPCSPFKQTTQLYWSQLGFFLLPYFYILIGRIIAEEDREVTCLCLHICSSHILGMHLSLSVQLFRSFCCNNYSLLSTPMVNSMDCVFSKLQYQASKSQKTTWCFPGFSIHASVPPGPQIHLLILLLIIPLTSSLPFLLRVDGSSIQDYNYFSKTLKKNCV